MRRRLIVAFALFATLLVVSVTPASATNLSVATQVSTESEFSNGTFDNTTVVGSGESAYVGYGTYTAIEDRFESGNLNGYTNGENAYSISTTSPAEGSYNVEGSGVYDYLYTGDFDDVKVSSWVRIESGISGSGPALGVSSNEGWHASLDAADNELQIRNGLTTTTRTPVTINQGTDYWASIEDTGGLVIVELYDDKPANGGNLLATLEYEADPASGGVGFGSLNIAFFDELTVEERVTNGSYTSAVQSVVNPAEVAVDLTLDKTTATVDIQTNTASGWETTDTESFDTSGNKTIPVTATGDEWRVRVSYSSSSTENTARAHDITTLFEPNAPEISNIEPADGASADNQVTFSADITDEDFHRVDDELTVSLVYDGEVVGSKTLSSNGSVEIDHTPTTAGKTGWYLSIQDSYGLETQSDTRTLSIPSELVIRNESDPDQILVEASGSASVSFYAEGDGRVYQRAIQNGTVDLAGLPADQTFVAVISADGYVTRRIIIDSILEQQSGYLLPDDATTANIVFTLDDQTGRFSSNGAQLVVQKAINVSGRTEYRNIVGDRFGSTGEVAVTLENDQRYRLRVHNDDGESRVLGSYTTAGDAVASLPLGRIQLTSDIEAGTAFDAAIINRDTEPAIRIVYRDPAENTSSLELEVRNENGTLIRPNSTENGPYGRYIETLPLGEDPEGHTYTVSYRATRGDGSTEGGEKQVGAIGGLADSWNIDGEILSMLGWLTVFGAMGLTVLVDGRLAGIVGPVFAGALTIMEIIHPSVIVIGLAGGVGLLFLVGGGR